jgi:CRISPR/Cas system CSM-associated protein Csm3 (group 7 of RAMP superfamily)
MANGFQRLERIVVLPVTYITHGYVSVHTGMGDGVRDNLVIREGGDGTKPIIPGSTIKGVDRSLVESLLAEAQPSDTICVPLVCSPKDGGGNPKKVTDRKLPCDRKNAPENEPMCFSCQLFGNTKQRSRVTFHDAKPEQNPITYSRSHVAISRETGTQSGGALMSVEAVPGAVQDKTGNNVEAVRFKGDVTLINPDDWMVGAVCDTLHLLRYSGVGARKSRGYGDLSIKVKPPVFVIRPEADTRSPEKYLEECLTKWRDMISKVNLTIPQLAQK